MAAGEPQAGPHLYLREVDAGDYLEDFLIAAIVAILAIRLFLELTGYPQIGGGGLHIAHMLWGGLLMLVAIVLLLAFIGKRPREVAAIIGGLGFGTFIDELGKFITAENDYFFQPTFALLYVIFVLLFLAFRRIERRRLTSAAATANAGEILVDALRRDLDSREKQRARDLLRRGMEGHPLTRALREAEGELEATALPAPGPLARIGERLSAAYRTAVRTPWFTGLVIGLSIVGALAILVQAAVVLGPSAAAVAVLIVAALLLAVAVVGAVDERRWTRAGMLLPPLVLLAVLAVVAVVQLGARPRGLGVMEWGEVVFSVVPAVMILVGAFRLRRSRLTAYRTIRQAVLILIFITQVFTFYRAELAAVLGLGANLVVLQVVNFLIEQEERITPSG